MNGRMKVSFPDNTSFVHIRSMKFSSSFHHNSGHRCISEIFLEYGPKDQSNKQICFVIPWVFKNPFIYLSGALCLCQRTCAYVTMTTSFIVRGSNFVKFPQWRFFFVFETKGFFEWADPEILDSCDLITMIMSSMPSGKRSDWRSSALKSSVRIRSCTRAFLCWSRTLRCTGFILGQTFPLKTSNPSNSFRVRSIGLTTVHGFVSEDLWQ